MTFRNNKNNEAFLDRVYIVKVPYCPRISEEIKIYEKLLNHSASWLMRPARRAAILKRFRASTFPPERAGKFQWLYLFGILKA